MTPDYLVSFPGLGIGPIPIRRIAFSIGALDVHWYGIILASATFVGYILALRQRKKYGFSEEAIYDFFLTAIISMIIGARLYYVAFSWEKFADDPWRVFNLRDGGMGYYGGLLGAMLGVWILCRAKGREFFHYADYVAPYIPLGQAIGRWGNFVNQEAFGVNTDLPWGMISNGTKAYLEYAQLPGVDPNLPVHPTFLYESLGNLLITILLFQLRKKNPPKGSVTFSYFFFYGLLRYFVEALRTDALFVGSTGLRISQIVSLVLMGFGVIYFIVWLSRREKNPLPPAFPREPVA